MSGEPRIFQGTFADFKLVKSRNVAQIVIEVPVENADAALAVLGGLPRPNAEQWVGVAALTKLHDRPVAQLDATGKRRPFADQPFAAQIVLLCERPAFWRWIEEHWDVPRPTSRDEAETLVKHTLGVTRKRDVKPGSAEAANWVEIVQHYERWFKEPVL